MLLRDGAVSMGQTLVHGGFEEHTHTHAIYIYIILSKHFDGHVGWKTLLVWACLLLGA